MGEGRASSHEAFARANASCLRPEWTVLAYGMSSQTVPQFATPEEWNAWFENELAAATPEGWQWRRTFQSIKSGRLSWELTPVEEEGCLYTEFTIEPSSDWEIIIVYCDNSDGGAGGIYSYSQRARVIHRSNLAFARLREILAWIFKHHESNVHGLT